MVEKGNEVGAYIRPGHPLFYATLDEAAKLHELKNQDYADKTDPLGNFKRVGQMLDRFFVCPHCHERTVPENMVPVVMGLFYKAKQFDAEIEMLAKNKVAKVEGLRERLMDQLVYSGLEIVLAKDGEKK